MNTISGQIIDLFNEKIFPGEITIKDGQIQQIKKVKSAPKNFIMPGFVDAHIHIESSMLVPSRFAQMAVGHGTVATVSDPHEIANVLGVDGINYMVADAKWSPFKFFWTVPSSVPATEFETSGAKLNSKEVEKLLKRPNFIGLSEVMNYPGVINEDPEVMAKIEAAKRLGKPIDGHAPLLTGKDLKKYVDAGITTDHECLSAKEAEEKINLGMKIWAREGSAAKNLDDLVPVLKKYPDMCGLCSDDLHPDDLKKGHINLLVKRLLAEGIDLFKVLKLANYNIVQHYNLDVGLLRAGDPADFIVVDDLEKFNIFQTWIDGKMAAIKGKAKFKPQPKKIRNNFVAKNITTNDIAIPVETLHATSQPKATDANIKKTTTRVINAIDHQLITQSTTEKLPVENNHIQPDNKNDILKIVVADRYGQNNISSAFIKGFGLKKGAIAATVAHDSHNIIAIGTNDRDIVKAINELIKIKGGVLAVKDNKVQNKINLSIAGLMSTRHGNVIAKKYRKLKKNAAKLGSGMTDPFMTMSFMALLVIPELKLSDQGLFDTKQWNFCEVMTEFTS